MSPLTPKVAPVTPVIPPVAPAVPPQRAVPTVPPMAPRVAPIVPPVAPAVPSVAPVMPAIAPVLPPAAAAADSQLSADQLVELERMAVSMDQLDYFELLGVEKTAAPVDIKRAFYRCSRTYHPDRFYHLQNQLLKDRVHEVYKRVTEAYAVLRDDEKRPKYVADVTGPDRAQKLRFTEASEAEAKLQKKKEQEEQIGTTPKGRQFYQTGKGDLDGGRYASAERNFKMALTFEPSNQRYKDALKEAQDKLLDESRKAGSQFKIK